MTKKTLLQKACSKFDKLQWNNQSLMALEVLDTYKSFNNYYEEVYDNEDLEEAIEWYIESNHIVKHYSKSKEDQFINVLKRYEWL